MIKCLIYLFFFCVISSTTIAQTNVAINQTNAIVLSKPIQSIITLVDGNIGNDIIVKYINTFPFIPTPTASEIVVLKKHGISDDIIMLILNKEKPVNIERQSIMAPKIVATLSTNGKMDPESYDFWFYHYAYPRALSYSYGMLGRYDK
jgi:hypothetical protein